MSIPVVNSGVNVDLLHPEMKDRLRKFFADPRIKGKVAVVSGVRTLAQQRYLYNGYKAGKRGFNLAANPDRKFGGGFQGSWHMQQPALGHYGYAVDFRIVGKGISTTQVNAIAKEYGIVKTVPSEWWHHQCYGHLGGGKYGWYPVQGQKKKPADPKKTKQDFKTIGQVIAHMGEGLKTRPLKLRYPYMRGQEVKVLQQRLGAAGVYRYAVDGIFGRQTRKCVKAFQKRRNLTVDGIVGPRTWHALFVA